MGIYAMSQIDNNMAGGSGREGVAVKASMGCGSQLNFDSVVLQDNAIIAGFGFLIRMLKAGSIAGPGLVLVTFIKANISDGGLEQEVAQIRDARPAKMAMSKSHDGRVGTKIAGTMIPSFRAGVGTELHHPKWIYRPGIGMPVALGPGSDHGIDLIYNLQVAGATSATRIRRHGIGSRRK